MKKINYSCDEVVYYEKLDNGLKVFMYPTKKSKNFYVTASTYFGAEVMKYKKGNKVYDVTKGSAHFLEHRVMDFTKNKEAADKLSEYGSLVNAYTTYNGTNYNIFGNEKILDNITLLFDRVFKAHIKEEDVEAERGIILEEYYMCEADPYYILETKAFENAFNADFVKYKVIGTTDGIKTVTAKELNRLYKDFYTPSNMFVVVCGNFDKDEVLEFIKEYMKDIKDSKSDVKVIKPKEDIKIPVEYEEMHMGLNEEKINIIYKSKMPKGVNKEKYRFALNFAIKEVFSKTGKAYEELVKNGIKRYSYGVEEVNDINAIYFKASTSEYKKFEEIVSKYLNELSLDEEALERKKRSFIRTFVLSFEDIVNVEDMITSDLFQYKKLYYNIDELVSSITLKDVNEVIETLDLSNKNVLLMKD